MSRRARRIASRALEALKAGIDTDDVASEIRKKGWRNISISRNQVTGTQIVSSSKEPSLEVSVDTRTGKVVVYPFDPSGAIAGEKLFGTIIPTVQQAKRYFKKSRVSDIGWM